MNPESSVLLSYLGPKEVLLQTPVVLYGAFDSQKIVQISLKAEDKYPLQVSAATSSGTWQTRLNEGFYNVGARWLRLQGMDANGRVIADQVINLTVTNQTATVGQDYTLRVLRNTLFKVTAEDSSTLPADKKAIVRAGQTFKLKRYGQQNGHLHVDLEAAIAPVGDRGYFFEPHVELKKGDQVMQFGTTAAPPVVVPGTAQMQIKHNTFLKAKPADSSSLQANQKLVLRQGQTVPILGYACVNGHFLVKFVRPVPNFGDEGYIFWQHVEIKKDGKLVEFDPDALTVTVLQDTVIKKRPVDSNNLGGNESYTIKRGEVYGVLAYGAADGHFRTALSENLQGFGNTGYLYPKFVQLREGTKPIALTPSTVELNVPWFSQRDNQFKPMATCNVTSIAMVMYYYGIRPKGDSSLEDELYTWCVNKYGEGSQTDNSVLVQLCQAYGFNSEFKVDRTWAEIKAQLAMGRPVVVGGLFTHSGHIVCVIGYTPEGYIVNDPYGNALTGYADANGRKVLYPYDYMDKMCDPEPGEGHIYAHFIAKPGKGK